MEKQQLPKAAIDTFIHNYNQLLTGKNGFISEDEIEPVSDNQLSSYSEIKKHLSPVNEALRKTAIIKLNGGLGTTMGLRGPKSLIPVKNNLCFLDITALQIRFMNQTTGYKIPLILMNSFKTKKQSCEKLDSYPDLKENGLPMSFDQHMFPKILVSSLAPASYPENPLLEWNPPGHGDIYNSLSTSGTLDKLLNAGYEYAFVSNIDNLGASLNKEILGYFAQNQFSFLMEVTKRTWMDRKGGHLARLKNGRLILREKAQCPPQEISSFTDVSRHSYFNTNNLWINLSALKNLLTKKNNILELPMIRNTKNLNPLDPDSPDVYQLESAMGSAISVFADASALRVPRTRFAPVKSCDELLLLWSDYYQLTDDFLIVCNPERKSTNVEINLDPRFYSWINDLLSRFPHGAPSLLECDSLSVRGDIKFGKNITIKGSVSIINENSQQVSVPDNLVIDHDLKF